MSEIKFFNKITLLHFLKKVKLTKNYTQIHKSPQSALPTLANSIHSKMRSKKFQIVYTLIFFATLGTPNAVHLKTHAEKDPNTTQSNSGFTKKQARAKQPKSSSEESSAERDRRLKRECRGRNNAGACLGYTQ